MARIRPGIVKVEGKVGDNILLRGGRYGPHMRKAVKPGIKKDEPALKKEYSRTGFLNNLASEINAAIKEHCAVLKSGRFYELLLSRFRKEPINNRLLLLQTLKGMEVNEAYPFNNHGVAEFLCNSNKQGLLVKLTVKKHPKAVRKGENCYCFEVLLLTWGMKEKTTDTACQYSEWVFQNKERPIFDFYFERPGGAVHWLVAVRINLGSDEAATELLAADGMQLVDSGSFDKREMEWLAEHKKGKAGNESKVVNKAVNITRIKASGAAG